MQSIYHLFYCMTEGRRQSDRLNTVKGDIIVANNCYILVNIMEAVWCKMSTFLVFCLLLENVKNVSRTWNEFSDLEFAQLVHLKKMIDLTFIYLFSELKQNILHRVRIIQSIKCCSFNQNILYKIAAVNKIHA